MIKLHGFGPAFGLVDPSPFVTKVMLFLTIHEIPFERINAAANLSKAPKKKFPFIEDGSKLIADSSFIIEYLSNKHDIDMDEWMSDEDRATAHLLGKSLEEGLYWCLVHSRWINDDTWPTVKAHFFSKMPFPLSKVIPIIARNGTIKRINGHGMGSHTNTEVLNLAEQSFESLSTILADKQFFFGDKISSLDIIAFAQLASFTLSSLENASNQAARKHANLVAYTNRIQQLYFPN